MFKLSRSFSDISAPHLCRPYPAASPSGFIASALWRMEFKSPRTARRRKNVFFLNSDAWFENSTGATTA